MPPKHQKIKCSVILQLPRTMQQWKTGSCTFKAGDEEKNVCMLYAEIFWKGIHRLNIK